MEKRVAISILNYKTYKYTIECIESLLKQTYSNYTIFLTDNASDNNSKENIFKFCKVANIKYEYIEDIDCETYCFTEEMPQLIYIQSSENLGYAKGNNLALNLALSSNLFDYYWVLNNDTVIPNDTLEKMIEVSMNDQFDRPVGNYIYYYDDKEVMQMPGGLGLTKYTFKPYHPNDVEKVQYLSGASFLVNNEFIKNYGFMPEEYFLNSEDLDYFYKFYREFKSKYPSMLPFNVVGIIYHKESATQGKRSVLQTYYYHRNLLYSNKKFKECNMLVMLLLYTLRMIRWLFIDYRLAISIALAIRDYFKSIKGQQQYNIMFK